MTFKNKFRTLDGDIFLVLHHRDLVVVLFFKQFSRLKESEEKTKTIHFDYLEKLVKWN